MTQIEEERLLIDAVVSALTPMLSSHQRGLMKQVFVSWFIDYLIVTSHVTYKALVLLSATERAHEIETGE